MGVHDQYSVTSISIRARVMVASTTANIMSRVQPSSSGTNLLVERLREENQIYHVYVGTNIGPIPYGVIDWGGYV